MPRSFYCAKRSTTTIFVSCFHTGIRTFFLLGPCAHFLSQPAPYSWLLLPPRTQPALDRLAPYAEESPSRSKGHMFLLPALLFSAFAQQPQPSTSTVFCPSSRNPVHLLCHQSRDASAGMETSPCRKAMTLDFTCLIIPFLVFPPVRIKTFGRSTAMS